MTRHLTTDRVEHELNEYLWLGVPGHLQPALRRWIGYGELPGDFLQAVLRNDLRGAVLRADDVALPAIRSIVRFMINNPPSICWGTDMAVTRWNVQNGLRGMESFNVAGLSLS